MAPAVSKKQKLGGTGFQPVFHKGIKEQARMSILLMLCGISAEEKKVIEGTN